MAGTVLRGRAAVLGAFCMITLGCGQKGPPLAPLHLVPAAVTDVSLRRVEDLARLRFVLPTTNANGPGRIALDRVEIYAITVAAGAAAPPNRDLFTKANLVGQIAVRPAPEERQVPDEGDPRPAPGDAVTFEEVLTGEALTPVPMPVQPDAARGQPGLTPSAPAGVAQPPGTTAVPEPREPTGVTEPPGTAAAAQPPDIPDPGRPADPADPAGAEVEPAAAGEEPPAAATGVPAAAASTDPVRIYVARGVTRGGRPGPPSTRVQMPIAPVLPPPPAPEPRITEHAVIVEWTVPAEAPAASFNVYEGDEELQPLNPEPLTTPLFEHAAARFGEEHCYRVRSVGGAGAVSIEGPLSEATCVTPRDVFPPAAPTGLVAVSTPGQISLIWDANTEPDLAGYLILRAEVPDGTLQPLTPAPLRETSYRDTGAKPGVRYEYAVIAVDTAAPPNMSAVSPAAEETAR